MNTFFIEAILAQDLIDETLLFCDKYASRFATPLTVGEFRERIASNADNG